MANEKLYSIIQRVKNGEKAEDIIDFSRESIDGYTPNEVLDLVKRATICNMCKKPLKDNELFFCNECNKKSQEHFAKKVFDREYKEEDKWTWTLGLIMVAGLFGFGKDNNNNDKNDKDKEN